MSDSESLALDIFAAAVDVLLAEAQQTGQRWRDAWTGDGESGELLGPCPSYDQPSTGTADLIEDA